METLHIQCQDFSSPLTEGQSNPPQTVQNNTERFEYHQTSPHSTAMVTDTLRLEAFAINLFTVCFGLMPQ